MKSYEYERNFRLEQRYWWFVGVRAMAARLLRAACGGTLPKHVLDVGCGTGSWLDDLRTLGVDATGLDFSADAITFCKQRGHTKLMQSDATHVALVDASQDAITAIGIIEHLDDDKAFLREMHRLLKPGAPFVMLTSSFPFLWSMHDVANEHRRRYYLRDLRARIEAAGFECIEFSHLNFLLFPLLAPALLLHRLFYGLAANAPERIMPVPPAPINWILTRVLLLENQLMRFFTLPWGVSMIGAFRKRA